ncbi:MAG TPA: ATP-grasp domain-containing protein, partial [Chitinophagaceae bacterium]
GKSFAGEVISYDELRNWFEKLKTIENTDLSLETKIIVSEPYNVAREWRLWITKKKVIAASQYREYFKLKKSRGCPEEVIRYAETRCEEYTPHDTFVMDICQCGDRYYIVECNCLNGAGFYNADVEAIIFSVTMHFVQG